MTGERILGLAPPAFWALAAVYCVLVAASFATLWLERGRPASLPASELRQRVRSWWLMVGLFTLVVLAGRLAAIVAIGLVIFLALKEYLSLIPTRRVERATLLWVYLTIPIQLTFAYHENYELFIVFVPVWAYLFITMALVLRGETQGFLRSVGMISWGLMMTVFALSHLGFLLVAGDRVIPVAGGAGLLFFLLFMTQANDVAQYVWGRSLGRRKILPTVSPNKTWEGFLGGLVTTTVLAAIAGPLLTPMPIAWSAAAGAMLAIAGFLGDVTMSALKRDLGVKDTSAMIPGHGGVLDRLDSLTFAAPVFTHAYRFFFFP
ncbi:MAG: phosphatidate cytidylyltransferase [Rhizobiales bacterium]|nr:phosphatidate cytidylyltransferase [Hyphomicrobiales bacterium]